jgi:hypothetical protein
MATKPPAVLDVGKRTQRDIRKLQKGEGKLFDKVTGALAQAQTSANGKEIQPVVIIFRKKGKRTKRGLAMLGPF